MINKILSKENIQLDVEVENFEEAIYASAIPLVKGGYITEDYVKSIVQIYKKTGPYIVITKNVALPHAPSDRGAIKMGISFTRLKKPVKSGNVANDPVKYLFCLSAPDSNSHLELLSRLVEIISSEIIINDLAKAKSSEEILKLINS